MWRLTCWLSLYHILVKLGIFFRGFLYSLFDINITIRYTIYLTTMAWILYKDYREKGNIIIDTRNAFGLKGQRNGKVWKA